MLTFSVNEVDTLLMLRVEKAISDNINYFKKFNGFRWEEAVNKTFMTAVQHAKSEYESLDPYIKNLARNILKEQEKEIAVDMVNEDGEVSYPFLGLTTDINTDEIFVDKKELLTVFKELYLLYEEDFLKLKQLYKKEEDRFSKGEVIRNEHIQEALHNLRIKYGAEQLYMVLYEFFMSLPKYSRKIENSTIKIIELRDKDYDLTGVIPDIPLIVDTKGNYYSIDKLNLTMDRDPDTFEWDTINQTSCNIIRIDMSPLFDYMYNQVFVPKGVFTKHITWCDDVYKVTTPGGKSFVNIDRNKFINQVKVELVSHLVHNRFNTIVAISPDYIYIKPIRMMNYDTVRLILHTGKIIDLPIEIYLKKRK